MSARQRIAVCSATAAAALLLAGCTGPPGAAAGSGQDYAAVPPRGAAASAPEASVPLQAPVATAVAGSARGTGGPGTALAIGNAGSAIERSVEAVYTVPRGSFLNSFDGLIARAVGIGGYVVSSTTQPDANGRIVSGSAALKVPAARLTELLDSMPASYAVSSIDFGSLDHTAAFVDVGARLNSARAHLAALDALLARAGNLTDVSMLDEQIATVQTEIDAEQGQLNVLTNSVALATATVRLSERGSVAAAPPPPSPIGTSVGGGWSNAVQVTAAVLEYAISALPLLVLGAVAWLAWLLLRPRGWRRRGTS